LLPKEIIEKTYSLVHIALLLEEDVKNSDENNASFQFQFEYFFSVALFIIVKVNNYFLLLIR
jgi:hypothetical protein